MCFYLWFGGRGWWGPVGVGGLGVWRESAVELVRHLVGGVVTRDRRERAETAGRLS